MTAAVWAREISIAGVDDRRERDWQTDAVLARCAVPEERRGGADQAVVVQRLHDRCPGRAGCAVNCGRQERQEVVDVDDVRPDGPGTIRDSGGGRGRPHGPHRQSDALGRRRPIGNGVIVDDEAVYTVAVACEELGLGVDDRVLSAGLAVAVVDDEDGSNGFELGNGHVIRGLTDVGEHSSILAGAAARTPTTARVAALAQHQTMAGTTPMRVSHETGRGQMRVLITGSEGYIGTILAPYLMARGHDVSGIDTGFHRVGWLYNGVDRAPAWRAADVRQLSVDDLRGFDAVVHLAELSNDPLGQLNPDVTFEINHRGSVGLATMAREAGVERFVYMSSCSVYGAAADTFSTESSPVLPLTAYAQCKVLVERDVAPLARRRLLADVPPQRDGVWCLAAHAVRPRRQRPGRPRLDREGDPDGQ